MNSAGDSADRRGADLDAGQHTALGFPACETKGQGLGTISFDRLIEHARSRGTARLVGVVLRENTRMLKLAAAMGFKADPAEPPSSGLRRMVLQLRA